MTIAQQTQAFLDISSQFKLGDLPTEQPHPLSLNLSELVCTDLAEAHRTLHNIDCIAMERLLLCSDAIAAFAKAISETFEQGGSLFIAGCGATGRLALTVETLCRNGLLPAYQQDSVIGFMAGGDATLIRSLEGFEDYPEYGARQLEELGFREGDLLIGVTEGGETPFVIGAVQAALTHSERDSWFCYCNPDDVLKRVAKRSRKVLDEPRINKLNLSVGPMALAGSTRMQATTVQLAAILIALECYPNPSAIPGKLEQLRACIESLDYTAMATFTEAESQIYQDGGHVLYQTAEYGLTVLTDTTERSPTFSLAAFENDQDANQALSLCYLSIPETANSAAAWQSLLRRSPRTLEWPEVKQQAGIERLNGFDISVANVTKREQRLGAPPHYFSIRDTQAGIHLQLGEIDRVVQLPQGQLLRNICLKVLLNAHSTLVMGRLGRYEGNLMTWVRPSNNKLIDRAIRYIRELYERRHGKQLDYAQTAYTLFTVRATMHPEEPIVLKTLEHLESNPPTC